MKIDKLQTAAFEKLSKLKAGALFMKMGSGKTKVAVELANSRKNDFDWVVWLAPASLVRDDSYVSEVLRWSDGLNIKFFTIESVSISDMIFLELRSFAKKNQCFCIIDESLSIKNVDAKRSRRLINMANEFKFRLILNGTPVSKGLIDFYNQINFISPKILSMTESQFANNFLEYRNVGHKPWNRWSRPANEEALIEILSPYIFDSDLYINVGKTEKTVCLELSSSEKEDYEFFKKKYLSENPIDFLAASNAFQAYYTVCDSKVDWIKAYASGLTEQAIIFVKFIKEIDALHDAVGSCAEFSGRNKDGLKTFSSGDRQFLIMTYGTGSKGLNLQFCRNIVFLTPTFDWAAREHGMHRIYRTGQNSNVLINDLKLDTGLDRLIFSSLKKKQDLSLNVKMFMQKNGLEKL